MGQCVQGVSDTGANARIMTTDTRPVVREVIVVEGKDDVAAVKRACQAQTITTSGLGISREMIEQIKIAKRYCGVIVLTDPDAPGEKIRSIIEQAVPGCKHAYLYRDRRDRGSPVGVEYANPAAIWEALEAAKATVDAARQERFTMADMVAWGCVGTEEAGAKRDKLSRRLGIGQANGKQFLRRLNDYGVSRQDFEDALQELYSGNEPKK